MYPHGWGLCFARLLDAWPESTKAQEVPDPKTLRLAKPSFSWTFSILPNSTSNRDL